MTMHILLCALACAALCLLRAGSAGASEFRDLASDTWVATDALGRELPCSDECGPLRTDRHVGIFYFLTFGSDQKEGPYNVTDIKAANPADPAWGPAWAPHYWGEPEHGYYLSTDEWVIRRHAYLLADAGVDTLIFDTTNDRSFPEVYTAIAEVFRRIRAEGERTPQFCFLASKESIRQLWEDLYSRGLYEELWFQWKGKPLLLFGQHIGMEPAEALPDHIRAFFTLRASWAWDSLPWYRDGRDQWPWVAHYPQCVGWHESPGRPEQVPVCIGQHPLSNIGRSFHDGRQPEIDQYDLTPFTGQGLCFAEQWRRALAVDPEFIFVTGWNEWTAGRVVMGPDTEKDLAHWCFFPGADLGAVGRPLKEGDTYFIDQYNQEYSRDAEPMRGGHTDNYYYQLVANVRRYKGVRAPERVSPAKSIDVTGPFDQWDDVRPEYRSHAHDTVHRECDGVAFAGPYINRTGRNDLVALKVARDARYVFFYAQTREPLTPHTDPNWMLLFIDADQSKATGWEGYDLVVNAQVSDAQTTTVCRLSASGTPSGPVPAAMRYEAGRLMLAVPRELFGGSGRTLAFDFHWADNMQKLGDITEFFVNGDSAPPRRFNYRYRE